VKAEGSYRQSKFHRACPDHPSTLNTDNNLGLLYAYQGRLEEAEKMYGQALAGYKKALGAVHTSTLNTVNNLGGLYAGQGKLQEADEMYRQALAGKEEVLGPDHISPLNSEELNHRMDGVILFN
jgi:tetratricopeptide (TPR) repeat protein